MPVTEQTPINSSTGNGVTTVFPYTFLILDEADIAVYVDDVLQTLTTDYTVSGVDNPSGGNVTFVSAPGSGTTVVRLREMAYARTTDYQENGDLEAATLDADLDAMVMLVQQLNAEFVRALKLPKGTTTNQELSGTAADRANKYLAFDSSGNLTMTSSVDPGTLTVSAFMETVLDDLDAASVRATLGLAAGSDIASAATLNLTAATGNLVRITGTTATTGVTINNGQVVLCYPTGAWPLTYHATNMPIKGGVSYTCAAGDTVIFSKDGNGSLHVDIFKADGTALVAKSNQIYGQCRLAVSGSDLKLSPFGGNLLTINGVACTIPDAGVKLVPTGTADDVFYIYAYMNAGTMTLEASTTARATSTTAGNNGNEIKSGDDTRTLVGMAYNGSDTWSTTLTWHNRRSISARAWLTANRTTSSTSIAEINTEARVYFLTWADEAVLANANGTAGNSTAYQSTNMAIGWDGVAVFGGVSKQANTTATSVNSLSATSVAAVGQLTERALHYCVLGGWVSANTGTFYGGADNADRTEMNVTTRG